MKIRKYVARNMPEALQQVRDDLGENAVILNTRQIRRNSRFNPHDEARVEVTAAYDEKGMSRSAPTHPQAPPSALKSYAAQSVSSGVRSEPPAQPVAAPPPSERERGVDLEPVLRQLRRLQEDLARVERRSAGAFALPEALSRLAERLRSTGVAESLVSRVAEQLFGELDGKALADLQRVSREGAAALAALMPACRPLKISRRRQVVGFFGASGAGKTTAAAKIAAGFALKRPEQIALVSADDRRVGALDQARAFARVIGVQMEIAYTEEEMAAVLTRLADVHLVLVDMPGCGPHEHRERDRQARLLKAAGVEEVQVVIDGMSSLEHMLDVVEASQVFGERYLLFTKMDEVVRPGAVLSAAARSQVPSSYFSVGATVPGAIEAGDMLKLVEKVTGAQTGAKKGGKK